MRGLILCHPSTTLCLQCTLVYLLGGNPPRLSCRTWRGLGKDPEPVDLGGPVIALNLNDDIFVGDLDILAAVYFGGEVVHALAIYDNDIVATYECRGAGHLLGRQLADEESAFDAALFPLLRCGREEVDDSKVGYSEHSSNRGIVSF